MVVHRRALLAQHPGGSVRRLLGPGSTLERRLRGSRPDRGGGDPAQPDPRPDDHAVGDVERVGDGDAGDVVHPPLGDLVERREPPGRQRHPHGPDQLVGPSYGLAVAGEEVGDRHLPVAVGRRQHDRGLQRQQRRGEVADRRGGREVAAEGGGVADQPGGEQRPHLVEQRHPSGQRALDLGERQRRPDLDRPLGAADLAQLGQPVDREAVRRPGAAQVDLDAPVGAARHQRRPGVPAQQVVGLRQVGGAGEAGRPGRRRGRGGGIAAPRQPVVDAGLGERLGGVADRPVAGAAAEVAADGVQVEALAVLAVVLRRHAAHEARRAVAALRAPALRQLTLHRVQVVGRAEPLGGDDLLAVERERGQQAGVDRRPLAAAVVGARAGDEHRAGPALALRAPLLGPGQPDPAQPVEGAHPRGGVQRTWRAVDGDRRLRRGLGGGLGRLGRSAGSSAGASALPAGSRGHGSAGRAHGFGCRRPPVVHAERRGALTLRALGHIREGSLRRPTSTTRTTGRALHALVRRREGRQVQGSPVDRGSRNAPHSPTCRLTSL